MKRTPTQVLEEKGACREGIIWVAAQDQSNPGKIFDDSLLPENEDLAPIGFYCSNYGITNGMRCVCMRSDQTPEVLTKLRNAFIADCDKEIE